MSRKPALPPSASEVTLRPLPVPAVTRFYQAADALIARFDAVGVERCALAVSGGADSMAMLRLAAAALPERVVAATFDHRLRPNSDAEAAMVARVCAILGVPHTTLTPCCPIRGSSIQMRARTARYAALWQWAGTAGARLLFTAHHADDQAETLLMRLQRASGLAGLAGIRPVRAGPFGLVVRPLLGWRRAELRALVEESGTPFVDDPSNEDLRHDRTRMRAFLADHPMIDPAALAASACHLAEAEEVVALAAERVWSTLWRGPEEGLAAAGEPRELRRRLLRRALVETRARLGVSEPCFDPDSANVEGLLGALEDERSATHAGILVRPTANGWIFSIAPPRRSL